MKNNNKTIFIILGLLILVIAFTIAIIVKNRNKNEYLINISYNELVKKIDNEETFILYIGKEGCSACEGFYPKFKNIIKKYKLEVYYLDLKTYTEEEQKYVTQHISFEGTPTVAFINNGKDDLNNNTKIVGNISEDKIIEKLKNRNYIK